MEEFLGKHSIVDELNKKSFLDTFCRRESISDVFWISIVSQYFGRIRSSGFVNKHCG